MSITKLLFPILTAALMATGCGKSGSPSGPSGPTGPTGPTAPAVPTISSAAPDSGVYNTVVTITGTNFSTTTSQDVVSFNGAAAVVSAATATQLTVTVPKGAGTGAIRLVIGANTATGPTFTYLYTYAVSTLTATGFNDPFGIAVDTAGNIIVADDGNNQIKMVTPAGAVTTVAGSGTPGFMNGAAAAAKFLDPPSVAVDPMDNILVGDAFNYKVREISSGTVSTLAGTTSGHMDGSVATAQFFSPAFLTVDASGNVFVCDAYYVRKVSGGTVSTLFNGMTYSTQLNSFTGVAVTTGDTLVLLDNDGWNVYELSPAGVFTVLAGSGAPAYQDGPAAKASFVYASAVAIDARGDILVVDEASQRIRMISPAGIVSTIAGSGTAADKDGNGTAASFNNPHGIAVDKKSGAIYVLEPMSNLIRKITAE